MSDYGIDYGCGTNNVDTETGIRFGVIPRFEVAESWDWAAEADYGNPTCPKCGNDAIDYDDADVDDEWEDNGHDYACTDCNYSFDSDEAYGDEPLGWGYEGEGYRAGCGESGDIFVTKSKFYTFAKFCSPCAPGACYLTDPVDSNGPRAYCFDPSWFDNGRANAVGVYNGIPTACPYPVYRIDDNECIYRPSGDDLVRYDHANR